MARSDSSEAEQSAIGAVARGFSAPWERGERPPDAYLTIDGRRIALDAANVVSQRPGGKLAAKARLRDDVVARRVLRDLDGALRADVPDGKALILTLGAPILVPKQLIVALTKTLRTYLASGAEEAEERTTVLGNRVRFRVVSDTSTWRAKVIGFVFSGDPAPGALADVMRGLHAAISAKAKARPPKSFHGDRWLVVSDDAAIADIKTYRRAYAQLPPPLAFERILIVLGGRRVERLSAA